MSSEKEKTIGFAALAIRAAAAVFNNQSFTDFCTDYDWQGFVEFCSKHKILNTVSCAFAESSEILTEKISKTFSDNVMLSMVKEAQRDVEIELLSDAFEENKIPHMIMKGYVIKDLYPQPFQRSMGDVDILVGQNIDKASEVILNHGFKFHGEAFLHDIFKKGDSLYVELHNSLIDESLTDLYDYFGIGFDRAKPKDGFKYKYELSKEDFYIFLVAHMAKHYKISGTGIRSVCDIYIYNSVYENELDRDYIWAELDKIELKKFEEKIRNLSYEWFSGEFSGEFDSVGEYIISGGVYGNIDNHELNAFLLNKEEKQSRFRYILRTVFPDMTYMQARYPFLQKCPFLLPFYWVRRFLSTLFKSRGSIRYRLKGVVQSDKSDYDRFDETGLR